MLRDFSLYDSVGKTIGYIEDNLCSRLKAMEIASQAYFSIHHFHRIFKRITGVSLMDYVKSRQLSFSAEKLLMSSLRICDIASEFGFEHYQSYIRAFHNEFGLTPSEFRRGDGKIKLTEPLDFSNMADLGEGMMIKPATVLIPEFSVIGIKNRIMVKDNKANFTANQAGKDFFFNERQRIKASRPDDSYYGITIFPENFNFEYTYYITGIKTDPDAEIPEGMVRHTVKTNKYWVFTYIGAHNPKDITYSTLSQIMSHMVNWTKEKNYVNRSRYMFEYIPFDICSDDYCEMNLYLPLN